MSLKRKRKDSENSGSTSKQVIFEGQVVKLTKGGEPDMRFSISKRFAAQVWFVQKALGVELVLKRICEYLPYEDLKKARSVNSFWNRIANPIFRKQSIMKYNSEKYYARSSKYSKLIQVDAALANQNLVAKVPISATIEFCVGWWWDGHGSLRAAIEAIPSWFARIHQLRLNYLTTNVLNRLLPFLLHQMPELEELYLEKCRCSNGITFLQDWEVPGVPADAKFSVTTVDIYFGSSRKTSIDPEFLRHCPNLKTFRIQLEPKSTQTFMDFFKLWKTIRSDTMKYENIEIRSTFKKVYDDEIFLFETLAEFINLNECRSVSLDCPMIRTNDYIQPLQALFLEVLPRLKGTTLRQLKLAVPNKSAFNPDPDLALRILKQCRAASKITDLTIMSCTEYVRSATEPEPDYVMNNLESVTSLTLIRVPFFKFQSLRNVFSHEFKSLHNVTSLRIVDGGSNPYRNYDKIFKGLKVFPKLVELDLGSRCFNVDRCLRQIKKKRSKGFFAGLGMLTGLRTFKFTIRDCGANFSYQNALAVLFDGYEPHVQLRMHRQLDYYNRQKPAEYTFTVEEFKEALKAAENILLANV